MRLPLSDRGSFPRPFDTDTRSCAPARRDEDRVLHASVRSGPQLFELPGPLRRTSPARYHLSMPAIQLLARQAACMSQRVFGPLRKKLY